MAQTAISEQIFLELFGDLVPFLSSVVWGFGDRGKAPFGVGSWEELTTSVAMGLRVFGVLLE